MTSFTYRLHQVGPQILAGLVLWPLEDGPEVLRLTPGVHRSSTPRGKHRHRPAQSAAGAIFLPPELHGRPVCAIAMFYLGDPASGEKILSPLRKFGAPY